MLYNIVKNGNIIKFKLDLNILCLKNEEEIATFTKNVTIRLFLVLLNNTISMLNSEHSNCQINLEDHGVVASGWLLCEKSAVRALSADYGGW